MELIPPVVLETVVGSLVLNYPTLSKSCPTCSCVSANRMHLAEVPSCHNN